MREPRSRWRRYFRPPGEDVRREVRDEFAFHMERRVQELVAGGMDADQARRAAARGFGDMARVEERCRTQASRRDAARRRREWVGALVRDAVFGVRQLRAHPAMTTAVVLTLALGIGGVTALFSVVDATLLRPLPFAGGERIVRVYETWRGFERGRASTGHYHTFLAEAGTLEALASYDEISVNLGGVERPERLLGAEVTPSYFDVLDVPPALGRYFTAQEGHYPAAPVAVLSWATWQTRFGGDPAILNRTIRLNERPYTVVGVTPRAFTLAPGGDEVFVPAAYDAAAATSFDSHGLILLARYRPDATLATVRAELASLTAGIAERVPENMVDRGIFVAHLQDELVRDARPAILALFAAVVFVLLMAAVNVASLLLARGASRRSEVAVRAALGGTRARLVSQFLTESLLLALLGGVAGLFVAWGGLAALRTVAESQGIARLGAASLNATALFFALGVTLLAGLGFGLVPALRSVRGMHGVLRASGRGAVGGRDRLRAGLVVVEVACALTLLVAAGLMVRSAAGLAAVPLGFEPEGVMTAQVSLPAAGYETPAATREAFRTMLDRLRATPGVGSAALVSHLPLTGVGFDSGIDPEGATYDATTRPSPHQRAVSADVHETLGMRVMAGRALQEADFGPEAVPVVLVNEELARRLAALYPEGGSVVGRRIAAWEGEPGLVVWREIVGVMEDMRIAGVEEPAFPELFFPYTRVPDWYWGTVQRTAGLAARTEGDPLALVPALRGAVAAASPDVPLWGMQPMTDLVRRASATRRFMVTLFAVFGVVAVTLAVVGIYGVVAFLVGQRTREIGVRQALGASGRDVVRMVLAHGVRLTVLGLLLGSAGAWAAGRLLQGLLHGVAPTDALAWSAGAGVLAVAALAATALPALRALRISPTQALRE